MIGVEVSKVLVDIEDALWEFEATIGTKPNYPKEGLRAATKIFMSVVMDKMFEYQTQNEISLKDAEYSATACGKEIRDLLIKYTGIDMHKAYSELNNKSN